MFPRGDFLMFSGGDQKEILGRNGLIKIKTQQMLLVFYVKMEN